MDKPFLQKIKFSFYSRIKKDLDGSDDLEIAVDILKNMETLNREEFMDRIDLIDNNNWRVKYCLMKLRVLMNVDDYRGYYGGMQ